MATPFSLFKRRSKDRKSGKIVTRICVRYRNEDGVIAKTRTRKAISISGAARSFAQAYPNGRKRTEGPTHFYACSRLQKCPKH